MILVIYLKGDHVAFTKAQRLTHLRWDGDLAFFGNFGLFRHHNLYLNINDSTFLTFKPTVEVGFSQLFQTQNSYGLRSTHSEINVYTCAQFGNRQR